MQGLGDSDTAASDGMIDVSLTSSSVNTESADKFSRMSASMFDPNMSQFYQSAKSVMMSASMMAKQSTSMFIGADPTIGVAVLKRTKQSAVMSSQVGKSSSSGLPMLGGIEEADDSEQGEI